jgi:hypothetical protein
MTNPSPSPCPSEFALERWRFGELAASSEEAALVAHVQGCASCRERQAELANAVAPTLDGEALWARAAELGVVGRPSRPSRQLLGSLRWAVAGLASAALVTVVALAWPRATPEVLLKGSAWRLGVIAKSRDGSVYRVDPGAPLSPGDRLRFEITTDWPKASIALVMLDSAGKVSLLSPAGGQTLAIEGGKRMLLDDAVRLDGALGPERIVLVGCKEPVPVSQIDSAATRALAQAQGDPRKVAGLGTGCHEESFWINKVTP